MGLMPLLLVLSSMEPSMNTNFLQFSTRLRTSKGAYTANYCACMDTVLLHHPAAWAHCVESEAQPLDWWEFLRRPLHCIY